MKTVIITGASRGIGKATAEKFLKEGWSVIATSTGGTGWEQDNLTWVQLDLSNPESIKKAVETLRGYGAVEVLINNAGVLCDDKENDHPVISTENLRKTLEINLIGTIDFTERLLAAGHIKSGGHIISMGSMLGGIGGEVDGYVPAYRISKVGLSMYTRTLAVRLKNTDITVSILDPGWVKTDMGGDSAPRSPEEPANEYFELATGNISTGKFWRESKERSW